MPTNIYTSTDVPKTIIAGDLTDSTLTVTDDLIITDLTCDVDITSPDEGSGEDPSLLNVSLISPNTSNILQYFAPLSLHGINFDIDRAPSFGSMNVFDSFHSNGVWTLEIDNFSFIATGLINSWGIRVTYAIPPQFAVFPSAPNAITIATNIKYGNGRHIRRNSINFFNLIDASSNTINSLKEVPFDCFIENINISANDTGTGNNTSLSLNKISNGVVTTLFSGIMIESNHTFMNRRRIPVGKIAANKGDILYFSVDTVGTSVKDLNVQLILNDRN